MKDGEIIRREKKTKRKEIYIPLREMLHNLELLKATFLEY